MDKNSQIKIIEDKIRGLEGNSFQDFCDRFCLILYPNDYAPVRPGGIDGDTKNDGYCPSARIFFQAHATRGEQISKTKSKIETNLKGCVTQYAVVKSWIYLTNDTLPGTIHKFVDDLRSQYSNLKIELWDHKIITNKIGGFSKEDINSVLDINLFGDDQLLKEFKVLLKNNKDNETKEVASSVQQESVQNIKAGLSGRKTVPKQNKSDDYKKVISLYKSKATKENITEIKKIVYSSDDSEAILQATLALASLYEYSSETAENQNTLLDIGIQTAIGMEAPDAEAILRAEKGINISTQFCLLDLEGWGMVEMNNRLGLPVITPEKQAEIVAKLKLLNIEFNELFKIAIDKAIESNNYLAISRIFSMIGSAAGGRAQHFTNLRIKERAAFEKKVCKGSFMYAKSILINADDKYELALLMHNFANSIRGFGEKEEALDLVDKAIKIAKANKIEDFMDKAELLRHRILNPLPNT